MPKKSAAKRLQRAEDVAIACGFLLKKLQFDYGRDFGEGMREQVRQAIRDTDQMAQNRLKREQQAASLSQPQPGDQP